jgi:hypothetical protein
MVYSNPKNLQRIYFPSQRQQNCQTENRKEFKSIYKDLSTNHRINQLPNLIPQEQIKAKSKVAPHGYRSQNVSKKRGMNAHINPSSDNIEDNFMNSFIIAVSIHVYIVR